MGRRTQPLAAASGPPVADGTLRGLAGYNIRLASNAVQADLARTLAPFGLRMVTFTALTLVADNPGLSQTRLAGALAVERSNLVAIVDTLEAEGLIERRPARHDRRVHALHATGAGLGLQRRALAAVREHDARMTEALGLDAREALATALASIERAGEAS